MDGYLVLRVIGEGSFGRALLVQQENSNQTFAMKEIRLPKSFSGTRNSRKEAVLLAKMKHPNIVAFKESFEAEGHLYIVMEYCDGGDLMQKIKHQKGKLFPEDMILNWFTQMCLGVNHIHKKRVLHRDIKSKNIFLTQNGRVKLGDFGSARLLSSPMAFACTYVGTPYYVPPEIWENMPYNNKSDIWSLGCILYELCTLKHPFQANSWKSLILKICQGSLRPLPSQYSCELQHLIKQMFKRNPSHRPSATTLLSRSSLARLVRQCLPPEIITEYGEQVLEETKNSKHSTPRKKTDSSRIRIALENEATTMQGEEQGRKYSDTDLESIHKNSTESAQRRVNEEKDKSVHPKKASSPSPLRRQWEKNVPNTALTALENAAILASSLGAGDDRGGSVIKYSENSTRKQWLKETPETLMNVLKNADLSLAFQTYTIYRPGSEEFLKGPLSEETEASDSVDGGHDSVTLDPERLEPRLDAEDTDFEEDDDSPDWVSELKLRAGWPGVSDGMKRGKLNI
ncbi:serine/threonine-protein kinase Nek3 isoform X1 [Leopardus geoffroyi]|uniref:serine/threonine-protein kinase Nek3 isoform X1 n=1 Tax=Leopardus geoffroyi TaxID=46844 RepID=UPI001E26272C|nr:serine/threonine-protein kinase Nek3 isoform X1 [Leopardus geoffroyi]XP_045331062.1 serine/threonine-protein kinase Nek3 isoform X2 [Leopardus geoffroyi]XP_045331064.1 serine/threonine-protein kinase Nek3 isoform X1 [Leopardus geoffroyi]XP_045331065.1 serine/threonine-protein kinase Nek3 isoform X1 [Leopardus geoffroyi]XP_045331069.1 serine/threonine-protein kinase Nek3 isoform X1 [Leopardus geoffroyi]